MNIDDDITRYRSALIFVTGYAQGARDCLGEDEAAFPVLNAIMEVCDDAISGKLKFKPNDKRTEK